MNKHLKTTGIILRRVNLNDADRIVTVLTKDFGKMAFFAGGCRRTKSKFCGELEPLNQIRITAFQGRNLGYLNEAQSIANRDFYKTCLRTKSILFYMAELTGKLIQDDQHVNGAYELMTEALDQIDEDNTKSELILYAYIIKLLTLLGFMGSWEKCAYSNEKFDLLEPLYLDMRHGSVVRSGYNAVTDPRLTPPLIKWVNFMQKQPFPAIIKVVPDKGEKVQVWYMIKVILENILSTPVKAEEFMARL